MSVIKVEKLSEDRKNEMNIPNRPENTSEWSVWECEPSEFDWHYDSKEIAYLYEGKVIVKTSEGDVEIQAGDLVVFPEGLSCRWKVIEKLRKVYKFE